jgi:hypothetical protein
MATVDKAVDKQMSMEYPVKNTFIEYPCMRSVSLEMFMKERETQSEPIDLLSRLESLESEFSTLDPSQKDSDSAKIEYLVKNTFIDAPADYPALRSRSLEEFLERHAKSCPTSGISQEPLFSLEEEPALEEETCAAPDRILEFPTTPSPRCRGTHLDSLESLEEVEYESPPEDEAMVRFIPSMMQNPPIMPGRAFVGLAQQHEDEPCAMYTDNFTHIGCYSDRSTMAPSDGDPSLYDSPQFPMERPDAQAMDYQEPQDNVGERTVVVELSSMLDNWSVGSTGHHFGRCKPCAFFWKDGCKDGKACQFCHTCPPHEKKRRTKDKLQWRRALKATRTTLRYGLF